MNKKLLIFLIHMEGECRSSIYLESCAGSRSHRWRRSDAFSTCNKKKRAFTHYSNIMCAFIGPRIMQLLIVLKMCTKMVTAGIIKLFPTVLLTWSFQFSLHIRKESTIVCINTPINIPIHKPYTC